MCGNDVNTEALKKQIEPTRSSLYGELDAIDIDVSTVAATLCGVLAALRLSELAESDQTEIICMLGDVVQNARDKLNTVQPRIMKLKREAKDTPAAAKEGGA